VDGRECVRRWLEHPAPWQIEKHLIAELRAPLNLAENSAHSFYAELSQVRKQAKARARSLDVLPNKLARGVGDGRDASFKVR
jgi:hypothetical protein